MIGISIKFNCSQESYISIGWHTSWYLQQRYSGSNPFTPNYPFFKLKKKKKKKKKKKVRRRKKVVLVSSPSYILGECVWAKRLWAMFNEPLLYLIFTLQARVWWTFLFQKSGLD